MNDPNLFSDFTSLVQAALLTNHWDFFFKLLHY